MATSRQKRGKSWWTGGVSWQKQAIIAKTAVVGKGREATRGKAPLAWNIDFCFPFDSVLRSLNAKPSVAPTGVAMLAGKGHWQKVKQECKAQRRVKRGGTQ